MIEIPTAEYLKKLSAEGLENYKREVLDGALFRGVLNSLEDSALNGYTSWQQKFRGDDDIRALKIIQKELQAKGFNCEFETKDSVGLHGQYKENYFLVNWGE